MSKEAMKLAREALMRSRKAVSGDLDLAGCAYGKNDPDGHRYDDAKRALETLDKAITALREALAEQPAQRKPLTDEEIEALLPEPDGTAEVDSVRVLVAPGLYGTEYSEADAWTKESVIQVARAIEAAHGIKEKNGA